MRTRNASSLPRDPNLLLEGSVSNTGCFRTLLPPLLSMLLERAHIVGSEQECRPLCTKLSGRAIYYGYLDLRPLVREVGHVPGDRYSTLDVCCEVFMPISPSPGLVAFPASG